MIIRVKLSRAENLNYFGCVAGDIVNIEIEEYVAGGVLYAGCFVPVSFSFYHYFWRDAPFLSNI